MAAKVVPVEAAAVEARETTVVGAEDKEEEEEEAADAGYHRECIPLHPPSPRPTPLPPTLQALLHHSRVQRWMERDPLEEPA